MNSIGITYLTLIFIIALISSSIVNLLNRHFIIQLAGIAFLFTYSIFKTYFVVSNNSDAGAREIYFSFIPQFTGIAACLVSMVLGFWIFPSVRKRIKS